MLSQHCKICHRNADSEPEAGYLQLVQNLQSKPIAAALHYLCVDCLAIALVDGRDSKWSGTPDAIELNIAALAAKTLKLQAKNIRPQRRTVGKTWDRKKIILYNIYYDSPFRGTRELSNRYFSTHRRLYINKSSLLDEMTAIIRHRRKACGIKGLICKPDKMSGKQIRRYMRELDQPGYFDEKLENTMLELVRTIKEMKYQLNKEREFDIEWLVERGYTSGSRYSYRPAWITYFLEIDFDNWLFPLPARLQNFKRGEGASYYRADVKNGDRANRIYIPGVT